MTRPTSSPTSGATASLPAPTPAAVLGGERAVVEPGVVDGVDVDAVARAVRACAGVADLYSGRFGEIGSYLPGRRVGGVQVADDTVTVHVRARWGYGVRDLYAQIGGVTAPLRHGRRVDVVVDDIDDDTGASADSSVTAATAVAPPLALDAPPVIPPLPESSTS